MDLPTFPIGQDSLDFLHGCFGYLLPIWFSTVKIVVWVKWRRTRLSEEKDSFGKVGRLGRVNMSRIDAGGLAL